MARPVTGRLSEEIQRPLARALDRLAPHSRSVEAAWRSRLKVLARRPDHLEALLALSLRSHHKNLKGGRFVAYHLALERLGESLEARGIPEEDSLLALALYLESALRYVLGEKPPGAEGAQALVRVVALGQLSLLAGYSHGQTAGWRALDERERLRLSRDLHDEIGHGLVVLKLYLEMIARDLSKPGGGNVRLKVDEAAALAGQSIASVRRLILDLGPAILDDEGGFLSAISLYARQFSRRTGITVSFRDASLPKLPSSYETALYRVVQGALSNVVRHAQATHVVIAVGCAGDRVVVMTIEDDGVGFEPSPKALQGFGIRSMRDRMESLGGRFHIASATRKAAGRPRGTRIEVDLPLRGRNGS